MRFSYTLRFVLVQFKSVLCVRNCVVPVGHYFNHKHYKDELLEEKILFDLDFKC